MLAFVDVEAAAAAAGETPCPPSWPELAAGSRGVRPVPSRSVVGPSDDLVDLCVAGGDPLVVGDADDVVDGPGVVVELVGVSTVVVGSSSVRQHPWKDQSDLFYKKEQADDPTSVIIAI